MYSLCICRGSAEISNRKWNNCLRCRRRKVKPTKEPRRRKGKEQEEERMNPSLWGECVLPLPWQSEFGVSGCRSALSEGFRKLSLLQSRGLGVSVLFNSLARWISWNMDWVPRSAKPLSLPSSCSCPAAFKAWVHMVMLWWGELCHGATAPRFCFSRFSLAECGWERGRSHQ